MYKGISAGERCFSEMTVVVFKTTEVSLSTCRSLFEKDFGHFRGKTRQISALKKPDRK